MAPMQDGGCVFGGWMHTLAHAPQLPGSFWVFTSQPSPLKALQSEKPMLQTNVHMPA
jgi:hypothetical protein